MCGIAGALDLRAERQFPRSGLSAMLNALTHRGPDDEASHCEPGIALGARRLSIVDLSGGRQPLANEDGSVWVAFNGELFDYPDVQRDLLSRGHRLRSRCDSEAWVHLYEDQGTQMFQGARGQFAVSLWDSTRRRLILARDRFGIVPLYYAESNGWLLWASEVKALFASGLVDPEPDPKGIDYFLNFFSQPLERTCFRNVRMLRPGHLIEAIDGTLRTTRYWDLDFPAAGDERRSGPLVTELETLLDRAVERRLRGDVPVACYLSGGLDSAMVLNLATRRRGPGIQSFTIGLRNGAGADETPAARETAALLGSPLEIAPMDLSQIANSYPDLIDAAEVPVLDTSSACMMQLAAAVHGKGFKVVLTGEGADEALAGYPWFKAQKLGALAPAPIAKAFRNGMLRALGAPAPPPGPFLTVQHLLFDLAGAARRPLYAAGLWERLGAYEPWQDLPLDWKKMETWHPLNRSLYLSYKTTLAGMLLLSKGDRVAMRSSVETRYPYLDEDVVDFCAAISPDFKLRGLTEKWMLRQVAARTLPRRTAMRPKRMFRAKLATTFLGEHRPAWVDQLLSSESLQRAGWFDSAAVAQTRSRRFHPQRVLADFALTNVVAVQLWHHQWCGGGLCELPSRQMSVAAAQ